MGAMETTRRILPGVTALLLMVPLYAQPARGKIQVATKYPQAKKVRRSSSHFDPSSPAWQQAQNSAQVSLELCGALRSRMYSLMLDEYERPEPPETAAATSDSTRGRASFFNSGLRNRARYRREAREDTSCDDARGYAEVDPSCGPNAPSGGVAPVPFTMQSSNGGYGAPAPFPAR